MCTSVRGVEASGAKFSAHREGDVGARYTNYSPCNGSRKGKRPLHVTSTLITNADPEPGGRVPSSCPFGIAIPFFPDRDIQCAWLNTLRDSQGFPQTQVLSVNPW